jgi:hypothetical protein
MSQTRALVFFLAATVAVIGCSKKESTETGTDKTSVSAKASEEGKGSDPQKEPDAVVVQHILVGFRGSVPGKPIARTQADAQKLAEELLARAKKGENFDVLVEQYTDDSAPGIYRMSNFGQPGGLEEATFPRAQMVRGFGDVSFGLELGEVGLASYDSVTSQYGWHVIKRLE